MLILLLFWFQLYHEVGHVGIDSLFEQKNSGFLAQSAEKCPPAIETSNPSQGSFSGGRFGCFFLWYPCMVYLPTFTNSFLAKCMHIIYHTWILWVLNNRSLCCESWRNMVKHFAYTEVVRDVI